VSISAASTYRVALTALVVVWSATALGTGVLAARWGLARLAAERPAVATMRVSRAVPVPLPVLTPSFAAPASGTTGTVVLPDLPALPIDTTSGVVAAKPFSLVGIGTNDRARALECLTAAIYYEAASESDDGQRAVAQVVLNRVRHPAFPASVCGVVYQGSEHAGCQFSFACDGAMARAPSASGWSRAARNAAAALHGLVFAPVGLATHYHTYAVTPAWNRTLVMTDAVGAHFFHRWKGWWGTPAAFSQRYRGGEPLPGPHAAVATVAPPPVPPPIPSPVSPTAITPKYVDSGTPLVPPAPHTDLPESTILDRWRDSGKPLR
jgi:hypothetical protein